MADIKDHFTLYPFIRQIFIEFQDMFWGWEYIGESELWSLLYYTHDKKYNRACSARW